MVESVSRFKNGHERRLGSVGEGNRRYMFLLQIWIFNIFLRLSLAGLPIWFKEKF